MTDQNQEYVEVHDEEIVESNEELDVSESSMELPAGGSEDAGTGGPADPAKAAGDTSNVKKASPPKTKAGMINAMSQKMSELNKVKLMAAYSSMMGEEIEVSDEEEVMVEDTTEADLEALISSDESLSEDFKDKAGTIFEAALNLRVESKVQELEEAFSNRIESLEEQYADETSEAIVEAKSELVDKIDSYLNYVVEQWVEENRLAVETGIRNEISEGFMSKLKDLFTESYIEVPESKVDLVDQLAEEVQELETRLNKQTATNMEMNEHVKDLQRLAIIREASKDLADTQATKLEKLAEGIEFEDVESFLFKVETIKESYFSNKSDVETHADLVEETMITEESEETDAPVDVSSSMAHYVAALKNNT